MSNAARLAAPVGSIALGEAGVLAPGRWRWLRALAWMVALAVVTTFASFPGWLHVPNLPRDAIRVGGVVAAYLIYAAAVRWGERRTPGELAPRAMLPELAIGVAIGIGMFSLVFAALRLLGTYSLTPGSWPDWPSDVLQTMLTGFGEELTIRLILFRLIMRAGGMWTALIASALLFGAGHLANPNATPFAAIAIAVEAGLMLAAFYLLTGRIWMSVGVHAAWNFAQGSIFGARVSGTGDTGSWFVSAPLPGTSDLLSGGAFGPEASLPAILIGAAVFGVVMWRVRGRQRR